MPSRNKIQRQARTVAQQQRKSQAEAIRQVAGTVFLTKSATPRIQSHRQLRPQPLPLRNPLPPPFNPCGVESPASLAEGRSEPHPPIKNPPLPTSGVAR